MRSLLFIMLFIMAFRAHAQFQVTRTYTAKSGYIVRASYMPGIKKPTSGARALT